MFTGQFFYRQILSINTIISKNAEKENKCEFEKFHNLIGYLIKEIKIIKNCLNKKIS